MVGSMPYSLEKGPYFAVIEDYANGSLARMKETLAWLRAGKPISGLGALDSTTLDKGPYDTQQLRDHLDQDWFGFTKDASGKWQAQAKFDSLSNPTTGFWVGWYGDCEAIFRQTLIRGIEVALGLEHGEVPTGRSSARRWYVEIFWRCPITWFEGWVTWRQHGTGHRDGQVTVLISTPGHGHPLENTPLRVGEPPGSGYVENPRGPGQNQGMWVVSQTYQKPWPTDMTASSWLGEWSFPTQGLAYASEGPVVTVAPPEREGGVLDPPRNWDPH